MNAVATKQTSQAFEDIMSMLKLALIAAVTLMLMAFTVFDADPARAESRGLFGGSNNFASTRSDSTRSSSGFSASGVFQNIFGGISAASARGKKVTAKIDVSEQSMQLYVGDRLAYTWKVSTGRSGYSTPRGSYRPTRMHTMWHSRRYNNAPMPHSVFFRGGYAVHGTNHIRNLGRPASHGCVRLHPRNAKRFYEIVKAAGMRNTTVKVTN